ncbi:1-deoxy-D-xylulose-5-phosphate reductoisomerase [Pyruvatibacter mobilis]|uniref:1-deoxy-D-xylulose 5-phosphate reductoisomerase n=1 Tax=Pyruvatibacter mobilis TaxID=1712261 RepID=A0A845QAI4_9HYPH|nr:1-deoxy-D-xylulose-5-phosphate reductoisomerase [Pyruvatibacter mobilis]NBG95655.1 1-deoxy-D-xylulose-5-phosphate reductoisomerase [Pyruvatibacter mobilis]QJD76814.1 1-deoxy-D-xylulose-5-phosphate reductoisomerase [Pyruvatibacter mobilis]
MEPGSAPRTLCVLGSTGSIGTSTLDLVARNPERFQVDVLTANANVELLASQARQFNARMAVVADPDRYDELKTALSGTNIAVAAGPDALNEAADRDTDYVMAAIVGAAGLEPTLTAARRGACVALANKECLVSAGTVFLEAVDEADATLLPVDSEHNAIFQVLETHNRDAIDKIILTASGGPFRTWEKARMEAATPAEAVAHPNWSMGAKISVDSATMMNKGLEVIEAYYLFGVETDQLDVLVHPQSVIHSMVAYTDGSVLAQLGSPDMRTPIAHTMAWPARMPAPAARLDLAEIAQLTFEAPDLERFPALRLALAALQTGGAAPTLLNAANEVGVAAFLGGEIGFLDIAAIVEDTMSRGVAQGLSGAPASLDDVLQLDVAGRAIAAELVTARRS